MSNSLNKYNSLIFLFFIILLSACVQKPKKPELVKNIPPQAKTIKKDPPKVIEKIPETKITTTKPDKINSYPLSKKQVNNKGERNSQDPKSIKPKTKVSKTPQIQENKAKSNTTFSLTGSVSFTANKQKLTAAEKKNTVIYFVPDTITRNQNQAKTYSIKTQNKRFKPDVLVIPVGSSITFPNQDRILHNVFSVSKIAPFDLGLYGTGSQKTVKFTKPGIAYVNCNVHHAMHADILVIDTPYFTQLDENDKFKLANLPSNKGKLFIWHPRAKLKSIVVNNNQKISTELLISRAKIPQHLNKFGSPYIKRRK